MKYLSGSLAVLLSTMISVAMAGEIKTFNQKDFDKLAAEGKPVVLDISATWCPICKTQKPIIDALLKQPAYKDVTLMTIDFDTERATLKKFKVTMQSTLVAFHGPKELGRSVGDTTPDGIERLINTAVN